MAEIQTSMYPTAQPPASPFAMVGQYAQIQNSLNQNALFQQTFRARQALGPLAQQSVGPDGDMDYNKFAVLISAHPDTAWMAPDIINGIVQRQLTQADTVLKNLDIAKQRATLMGQYAGGAIADANQQEGIPQDKIMGVAANYHAMHLDAGGDGKDVLRWASTIGYPIDPKTGGPDYSAKYSPTLAYKQMQQLQVSQMTSADQIGKTKEAFSQSFGGGTKIGTRNALTGQFTPTTGPGFQPGGVLPQTAGPGVKSTVNPATGLGGESLVGQPLPPTGGPAPQRGAQAPGIESITGGAPEPQGGGGGPGYSGGAAGPQATQLSPVQAARMKEFPAYIKEVNDQATKSLQMNQLMDKMDEARQSFKTGAGMEGWVGIAKALQSIGFPSTPEGAKTKALVDRVAGGDLGAAQEYNKLQAQLAAAVLKNALMPGAGRILQSEYDTFTKANANWDTDPRGIDRMFQFMRMQNMINLSRQTLLNKTMQEAEKGQPLPEGMSSIADFEPWFNKLLVDRKYISGATAKTLGAQ